MSLELDIAFLYETLIKSAIHNPYYQSKREWENEIKSKIEELKAIDKKKEKTKKDN